MDIWKSSSFPLDWHTFEIRLRVDQRQIMSALLRRFNIFLAVVDSHPVNAHFIGRSGKLGILYAASVQY